MIDRENTTKLIDELRLSPNLDQYLKKYDVASYLSFPEYVNKIIDDQQLRKSQVIAKLNMARSYAYEILNGFKKPSREKVILLSYALGIDYKQSQKLLISAKHNPLHPKDKRDSIIIYAKYNHHTLIETNMLLDEFNEDIIE